MRLPALVTLVTLATLVALSACTDRPPTALSVDALDDPRTPAAANRGSSHVGDEDSDSDGDRTRTTRQFTGGCSTRFTPPRPSDAGALILDITGDCTLSGFGRLAFAASQTVTRTPNGEIITNTGTYTAADGSLLRSTFVGRGRMGASPTEVCFTGVETYAGGAGRFANVRGAALLDGCAQFPTLSGGYTLQGVVQR